MILQLSLFLRSISQQVEQIQQEGCVDQTAFSYIPICASLGFCFYALLFSLIEVFLGFFHRYLLSLQLDLIILLHNKLSSCLSITNITNTFSNNVNLLWISSLAQMAFPSSQNTMNAYPLIFRFFLTITSTIFPNFMNIVNRASLISSIGIFSFK